MTNISSLLTNQLTAATLNVEVPKAQFLDGVLIHFILVRRPTRTLLPSSKSMTTTVLGSKVFFPSSILGFYDLHDLHSLHNGFSPGGLTVMGTIVVVGVPVLNVEEVIASSIVKFGKPNAPPTPMRIET
ncbi:hypothetical protein VNO80_19301 [Phaseolus coccineus]|uniref:Uncharacterized protein n=1 Tax=Phaseolus coccineus TaxID=3886 RepID=A0AAN9MKM6_PHACN